MGLDSREKLQQRIGELEDENKALVQKVVDQDAEYAELKDSHAELIALAIPLGKLAEGKA